MAAHTIYLSNNTSFESELVVYRDWTESNGKWRLFWANTEDPNTGVYEQSTVTGQPFFSTRKSAVQYGKKRYGETARTAVFHRN